MATTKIKIQDIIAAKQSRKISMVTCYDSAFAKIIDRTPIDMILVGDSMGNVVLGMEDTISVTLDHIVHHTRAVTNVVRNPLVVADMPFMTYKASVEQAMNNAARLVQEGGAHAVKLEGGVEICPQIKAIVDAGIPVVGHLGLTPQSINSLGGHRVQGRSETAATKMMNDAIAIEEAGAFAIVFEMIPSNLGKKVTGSLSVPTIGIGAGSEVDGQVLVLHDLLGFDEEFNPKFLKKYANLSSLVFEALSSYDREVKGGVFPGASNGYE